MDNVLNLVIGFESLWTRFGKFFKYRIFCKRVLRKVTSCLSHFAKSCFRNGSDKQGVTYFIMVVWE